MFVSTDKSSIIFILKVVFKIIIYLFACIPKTWIAKKIIFMNKRCKYNKKTINQKQIVAQPYKTKVCNNYT